MRRVSSGAIFVQKGNEPAQEFSTLPEDVQAQATEAAIVNLGTLLALLRLQFGLHTRRTSERGQEPITWGYHWHDARDCLIDEERDEFVSLPAAIVGAIYELTHVYYHMGALPVLRGLQAGGFDLVGLPTMIPPDMEEDAIIRLYERAMRDGYERIAEAARAQPSGFNGKVVADFLGAARNLVDVCGAEAHDQLSEHNMSFVPRNLDPGYVAVPAMVIVAFERLLEQMRPEGDTHAPTNQPRRNVARSA